MTSSSHPASHPLGIRLPDPTSVTTAALRDRCHICDTTEGVVFRQARGYQIVACVACGTRYLSPQPTAADLTELYPDVQILVTGVEDPDSRAHSANESLHLGDFRKAILAEALLLARINEQGL